MSEINVLSYLKDTWLKLKKKIWQVNRSTQQVTEENPQIYLISLTPKFFFFFQSEPSSWRSLRTAAEILWRSGKGTPLGAWWDDTVATPSPSIIHLLSGTSCGSDLSLTARAVAWAFRLHLPAVSWLFQWWLPEGVLQTRKDSSGFSNALRTIYLLSLWNYLIMY